MRILLSIAIIFTACGLVIADDPKPSRDAKIDKLLKRIDQLEQRVKELEKRPTAIPTPPSPYYQPPVPYQQMPNAGPPGARENEVPTNNSPGQSGTNENSFQPNGSAPTYQRPHPAPYAVPHGAPYGTHPYPQTRTDLYPVPNDYNKSKRKDIPDSWSPFQFNGQEYYIIPLGEAKAMMKKS